MIDAITDIGARSAAQRWRARRVAVVVSLLLILGAAGAALDIVRSVDSQIGDILRAQEVRRTARDLTQSLVELESGQRGYLLTQDPAYLEPYDAARRQVDGQIDHLVAITADNPQQKARIVGVIDDIGHKLAEMARTVDLAENGRIEEARALVKSDLGAGLMRDIRSVIDDFIAGEDEQLASRNEAVANLRLALIIAVVTALAGAGVLVYVLSSRTQRQVRALTRSADALLSENEELEARVSERTAALEEARSHADRERARVEAVLQDTNHRIGNSLATVSSLLGLQMMRTQSPEIRTALEAARDRVQAIASGHRRLRLGDDMETTRADEFLIAVLEDIRAQRTGTTPVRFEHAVAPVEIMARDATTLGIMAGELVTNALKHAFPHGRGGTVVVRFGADADDCLVLAVEDDGIGISPDRPESDAGLGSMIIKQLARQFGGEPSYAPREGGGTVASVRLPALERPVH